MDEKYIARFWSRVEVGPDDVCWPYRRGKRTGGYGQFHVGYSSFSAHRFAYVLTHGSIPVDAVVRHKCDNPPCCNPAHLEIGSPADNNADRHARGRDGSARGEANGRAKLTAAAVAEIRAIGRTMLQREIASRYGITQAMVSQILLGNFWR